MFARETPPTRVADGVVQLGTELVNWYLLEEDGRVTVVDCGSPAYRRQLEPGLTSLGRTTADVAAVVLTHAHDDHLGFAETLRSELGVAVYVHRNDEQRARTRKSTKKNERSVLPYMRHGQAWKLIAHLAAGGLPKPLADVRTFEDGETLDVPGHPRVVHTPGHTDGHACFWVESRRALFGGDLLCTRNPLTGSRGPQLMPSAFNLSDATILDSLTKIEQLEAATLLFGHGEPWTGGAQDAVRLARGRGPT
jgi:glyoxylase-like metal-dependent hydrolase (beta-lactamase superfamily II)